MAIVTSAPTGSLKRVFGANSKLFYAMLFPGVFSVLLLPVRTRGKKRLSVAGCVGLILSMVLWTACGNSKTVVDPGTQPIGMRQFSVTASANGQIQHTLTLTMNIQ
jgi:hypothetical protein